jgi:hypothetical protein
MSVWYQMGQSVRNLLISLTSTSKAILDTESNIQARTDWMATRSIILTNTNH